MKRLTTGLPALNFDAGCEAPSENAANEPPVDAEPYDAMKMLPAASAGEE